MTELMLPSNLEDVATVVLSISTFNSPDQSQQNQIDYRGRQWAFMKLTKF